MMKSFESINREHLVPALRGLLKTPVTVTLTALVLCVFMFKALTPLLEIQFRESSGVGLRQLLGCHLLHWSASHLFWDLGMFVALGLFCEQRMPARFMFTVITTALLVPLAVMISQPNMDVYRGLSGIDTALFSLFAMRHLIEGLSSGDRLLSGVHGGLLLLLLGKTAFELVTGHTLFVQDTNFTPLPIAHLVGMAVGAIGAGSYRYGRRSRVPQTLSLPSPG